MVTLKEIVRQQQNSGILTLSFKLRTFTEEIPRLIVEGADVHYITGMELQEELESAFSNYGRDNVMVVCRSNKQANLYNQQIRHRILWQEEEINAGDIVMAVQNNYFWLDAKSDAGFIANGEMMEIQKIVREEELYGFRFADALVCFIDYPDMGEVELKILIDTLHVDGPGMPREQMKELFYAIAAQEYGYATSKSARNKLVMKDPYFQAVQVKFGYAVTCHKSQGGQWDAVFVDHGYFTENMWDREYMRWLYTAVTRAQKKLFLVNFSPAFGVEVL